MSIWKSTTLGEVCTVVNGATPKTGIADYWDGDHLWITPAEMGKRDTPYIDLSERRLTDAGLSNCSASLLPAYSVILSSRAPIGHLVINTKPMATNQGCKGLIPCEELDYKFLYYYMFSIVGLLNELGTGATFKELSSGKLKEVPIPLPPLAEQRRIVALLDDAFAGLETLRANAETCKTNIDELYQSQLDAVFKNPSWSRKSLSQIAQINYGYTEKAQIKPVGPKFLRITDIQDGRVAWEKVPFCKISEADKNQFSLCSGDIVFARTGATTGKSYLIVDPPDSVCASYLIRLRVIDENIVPDFVFHFFKTGMYWRKISAGISGSAQGGFNASKLGEMTIHLPPKATQQTIINQLNEVNNYYSTLKITYTKKLAAIDNLKQSLLHRAFSGQLTAAETAAA